MIKTIIYFSLSILITACGDDDGSKTFSTRTRGGGAGAGSTKTISSLTDEQKKENTVQAILASKNSLSDMILNTSAGVFAEFSDEYGQEWMSTTIREVSIPDVSTLKLSTNLDDEKQTDQMFKFDENENLVLSDDFLDHFDALEFSNNPLVSIRKIKLSLLKEIHSFLLDKFSQSTDESESAQWAQTVLEEGIGKDNLVCSKENLIFILNKPTGLARMIELTNDSTFELDQIDSIFKSPEDIQDLDDKQALISKIAEIAEPSLPAIAEDNFSEKKVDQLFSVGRPIPSAENDEVKLEYLAADDVNEIELTSVINKDLDNDNKESFSTQFSLNGTNSSEEFSDCLSQSTIVSGSGVTLVEVESEDLDNEQEGETDVNSSDQENFEEEIESEEAFEIPEEVETTYDDYEELEETEDDLRDDSENDDDDYEIDEDLSLEV